MKDLQTQSTTRSKILYKTIALIIISPILSYKVIEVSTGERYLEYYYKDTCGKRHKVVRLNANFNPIGLPQVITKKYKKYLNQDTLVESYKDRDISKLNQELNRQLKEVTKLYENLKRY